MLLEGSFKWFPKDTPNEPKELYCNIQPSLLTNHPTLLNMVSVVKTATLYTPDIEEKFEILDKVLALGIEWYITSISETHSQTVSKELWHKKLSLTEIPPKQFEQGHLSQLFSHKGKDSTLKLIKEHLSTKSDAITIIEQFDKVSQEPLNCILLSLDGINYGYHKGYDDDFILSIATVGLRGIGEKAHQVIKTFSQELMSINHDIGDQINASLDINGIKNPASYVVIQVPVMEEFRMAADYAPEYILRMGLKLPYIEGEVQAVSLPIFSIELKTTINIFDQLRSSYVTKFQKPVGTT